MTRPPRTRTRPCTRCGAELPSLADLADLALTVQGQAVAVAEGWRNMRLSVPQSLAFAMRDLERDAPRLASHLACYARRCSP